MTYEMLTTEKCKSENTREGKKLLINFLLNLNKIQKQAPRHAWSDEAELNIIPLFVLKVDGQYVNPNYAMPVHIALVLNTDRYILESYIYDNRENHNIDRHIGQQIKVVTNHSVGYNWLATKFEYNSQRKWLTNVDIYGKAICRSNVSKTMIM